MFSRELYNVLIDLAFQTQGDREKMVSLLQENMNTALRSYHEIQETQQRLQACKRPPQQELVCPCAPKKRCKPLPAGATVTDAFLWIKEKYEAPEETRSLLVNELLRFGVQNQISFHIPFQHFQEWITKPMNRALFLESESSALKELYQILAYDL